MIQLLYKWDQVPDFILWLVKVNSSLTVCFVKFGKDLGLQDTITLAALLGAGQWEIQASVCQSHVIDKFNIVYFSSTCICCFYFFIGCVLFIAYFTRTCFCFWTDWTAVHDSHISNILYLFCTCCMHSYVQLGNKYIFFAQLIFSKNMYRYFNF